MVTCARPWPWPSGHSTVNLSPSTVTTDRSGRFSKTIVPFLVLKITTEETTSVRSIAPATAVAQTHRRRGQGTDVGATSGFDGVPGTGGEAALSVASCAGAD